MNVIRFVLIVIAFFMSFACSNTKKQDKLNEKLVYVNNGTIIMDDAVSGDSRKFMQGEDPALSFDGRLLAYTYELGSKRRIAITRLDNAYTQVVEDIHGASFLPVWSPTNHTLLFNALVHSDYIPHRVIIIYDILENRKTAINRPKENLFFPVWDLSGDTIYAHNTRVLFQWDIFGRLISARPLTEFFGDYRFDARSQFLPSDVPGEWIFTATDDKTGNYQPHEGFSLFRYDPHTKESTRLLPAEIVPEQISWDKPFQEIFISTRDGSLYRIDKTGGMPKKIRENASQVSFRTFQKNDK